MLTIKVTHKDKSVTIFKVHPEDLGRVARHLCDAGLTCWEVL